MENLPYLSKEKVQDFIRLALLEDVGSGDHSTLGSIPQHRQGQAKLLIKESGIIAGLELAEMIFKQFDPNLGIEFMSKDGEKVNPGDIGFTVKGSAASILTTERLILNCLQRMSGIATKTSELSGMISHTKAKLMDTRKTTPNFRMFEKWAVALGGGRNHRFALYDMVMLKDNHIDFAGGIAKAIQSVKTYMQNAGLNLKIEVETRNLQEVQEVLNTGGVDYIMLDNMDYDTMREAVRMVAGKYLLEASGGITEQNLKDVAECGVDFISVGALTHHVKSMDISLKAF